ncbi:DUF4190 domain-containing protein [Petropleomorpha daqingensis]|uniref:DUF4190 domain-containing protein n=1 Tax=Petropleomorpha daqingensis TaxID=2026353 RepID=A0A853CH23_9ACTN|nr:DUF4190 domain-containing protein [Petropleomorpha daqingensis]NYJ05832.1 hypothetical protein [Petropleomorpha daqingensis]
MTTEQYDSSYPQNPQQPPAPQGYQAPAPQPYGAPVAQPYGYPAPQAQAQGNGLGIAGFVCGLVGLILCWVPWFGMLLGVVGIVLSGIAISQGKKRGTSTGLAIAGLVCGILAVLAFVLLLAFVFSVASSINTY